MDSGSPYFLIFLTIKEVNDNVYLLNLINEVTDYKIHKLDLIGETILFREITASGMC